MPAENKKIDPFKPQQPHIPGVPDMGTSTRGQTQSTPSEDETVVGLKIDWSEKTPLLWIALVLIAACAATGGFLYSRRNSPTKPLEDAGPARVTNVDVMLPSAKPVEDLPVAPGPIATTGELAKDWSARRFLFRDPFTSQFTHAMVVRLPGNNYWGFSLREPFGNCELELVTNLQKLRTDYQFQAAHPMLGNPCNHTVYDLMRYGGGAPNDGLVRGEIVQGSGLRPPMAIEIQIRGNQVVAGRTE